MSVIHIACAFPWQDRSAELNEIIRNAPENTTLHFEPGEYYLRESLRLEGKHGLTFDAPGCTFTCFYDPAQDEWSGVNQAFAEVDHCSGITFSGFVCRQEKPANVGGEFLDVQPDHVDVKFFQPLTGKERFTTGMTFNDEGRPGEIWWMVWQPEGGRRSVIANEIVTTAVAPVDVPHEDLGNNCFRIYKTRPQGIRKGMRCNIKHCTYGNSVFVFRNTVDMTMEDVTIPNWGGFAVTILPRCRDFTFRRLACRVLDRQKQPYSVTLDAIHTTGLGGKLLMEDCFFEGLGDDVLNSHTATLKVTRKEGRAMTVIFDKPNALFPARWGAAGDTLIVYDKETLRDKGEVTLVAVDGGELELADDPAVEINVGDYVVNRAYIPEIVIRNTTAVNSRSRICIQAAQSLEISHCKLAMASFFAPIYISSAFRFWGEGGGVANVDIHDNEIRVPFDPEAVPRVTPAIWIRVNDINFLTGKPCGDTPPRTRYFNINIRNNVIAGFLDISNCEGLTITGNRFDRPQAEALKISENCRDVRVE